MSDKYPDSSGILFPNMEVQIVDENDNKLGPNEDGEICVNNGCLWPGYHGDESATEEVYDAKEGWYHSGDKGHFDENGYLYIVDRLKEIMKCKGYHVSPTEIEGVILELQDVVDVCVCGIPDLINMNLPAAMVITTKGSSLKKDEIIKHVEGKLPHYKHLSGGVYFVDELPRTPSGKIMRRVARFDAEKFYNASKK
uniref:AMP-binding enzyme C-terminal domain-containing protein n=1 Tax=Megaselia scalaris TaxID=36166 RepID=T1GWV1_MEGSC